MALSYANVKWAMSGVCPMTSRQKIILFKAFTNNDHPSSSTVKWDVRRPSMGHIVSMGRPLQTE